MDSFLCNYIIIEHLCFIFLILEKEREVIGIEDDFGCVLGSGGRTD